MPGGRREGFLRRGEREVNAPVIDAQFRAEETADRIDQHQRIVILAHDGGDLLDRVGHAGAGFVVDDADRIIAFFLERVGDHLRRMRLAPLDVDAHRLLCRSDWLTSAQRSLNAPPTRCSAFLPSRMQLRDAPSHKPVPDDPMTKTRFSVRNACLSLPCRRA